MSEIDDDAAPRKLKCPKCSAAMESIVFHDITVDRCSSCHGLWFDALEKDHLDELKDSASIDIGSTGVAAASPAQMNCPVCHTRMFEMGDQKTPTTHFHACKVCYGLFFDAGKYREHKEHGVMSLLREMFHRKAT
jgi:Zn-finger nucleic acid-binding protein